jgi:predicted metalloprotease
MGRLGLGGILLVVVVALVTKQNPMTLLGLLGGAGEGAPPAVAAPIDDPAEEQAVEFVSFVLDDAQVMWSSLLPTLGTPYRPASLVLFRDRVTTSGCGAAGAASGPFYCPADEKVYIDLSFYRELANRFGAPGDFAEAYVLAHEVGHHVQTVLGTNAEVTALQRRRPDQANQLSVRLELQADCYAGIWANRAAADGRLEIGDLEEGLRAAAAVGDDRLQQMGEGEVQPESWTHGSSEQRMRWFRRGFESGDPRRCDTFAE